MRNEDIRLFFSMEPKSFAQASRPAAQYSPVGSSVMLQQSTETDRYHLVTVITRFHSLPSADKTVC